MGSVTNMVLTFDAENSLKLVELCQKLTEERDALAAELAQVRAGLPRWRNDNGNWVLGLGGMPRWVSPREDKWKAVYYSLDLFDTKEAAMLAVTTALGLPPCEVEGE